VHLLGDPDQLVAAVSTDAGATLTAVIGVLLARLSFQGTFRRYVKPAMGLWLGVAGILLALLGLAVLLMHRAAGNDVEASNEHDHGGHGVAWLLLLPVLALLLIAPRPLGSYALGRTGQAVRVRPGAAAFPALDPTLGPRVMTLLEFDERALEGDRSGASFASSEVSLTGFVAPSGDEGFLVARYSIACCAADALAATAHAVGWDGPRPRRDSWVIVTGQFEPGGDVPRIRVDSVTPIPAPNDPYET
jgi:uncharacterized repeat protein (TIGR03943 family)